MSARGRDASAQPRRRRARDACAAIVGFAVAAAAAHGAPPPAQDYVLECRGCHGERGQGSASVPALTQTARFLATPRGRAYLVRVPGVAGSQLSDARVAALLDWVLRELASDPAAPEGFAPFSAAEVSRSRVRRLLEPRREREEILGEAQDARPLRAPASGP